MMQRVEEYNGNYCVLEIPDWDHLNMDELRSVQEIITDAIRGPLKTTMTKTRKRSETAVIIVR